METIKINDIEYVKKEEYDKLASEPKYTQKEGFITDKFNVIAIVPFKNDKDMKMIGITGLFDFKLYEGELKLAGLDEKFKAEKFILSETKYGFEFLEKAIKTAKAWGEEDKPLFYMKFAEGQYIEDMPCLIKIGKLTFVLAPRVESTA